MAKPRTNKWSTLKASMIPEAMPRVDVRVREMLAAMPIAEIRRDASMTQTELGGKFHMTAEFPNG